MIRTISKYNEHLKDGNVVDSKIMYFDGVMNEIINS